MIVVMRPGSTREQVNGIVSRIQALGLGAHAHVLAGEFTEQSGVEAAQALLRGRRPPTAVFAANDLQAAGLLDGFSRAGVRVPDDLSLIGFDNIKFGEMVSPPLTTIEQPKYELGTLACTLLLSNEGAGAGRSQGVMLEPQLVRRASVQRM